MAYFNLYDRSSFNQQVYLDWCSERLSVPLNECKIHIANYKKTKVYDLSTFSLHTTVAHSCVHAQIASACCTTDIATSALASKTLCKPFATISHVPTGMHEQTRESQSAHFTLRVCRVSLHRSLQCSFQFLMSKCFSLKTLFSTCILQNKVSIGKENKKTTTLIEI